MDKRYVRGFINILILAAIAFGVFYVVFAGALAILLFVADAIFSNVDGSIFLLVAPIVAIIAIISGLISAIVAVLQLRKRLKKLVINHKGVYYLLAIVSVIVLGILIANLYTESTSYLTESAISEKNAKNCNKISSNYRNEEVNICYEKLYAALNSPIECEEIAKQVDGNFDVRDKCYQYFALNTGNFSLCSNIRDDFQEHDEFFTSQEFCYSTTCALITDYGRHKSCLDEFLGLATSLKSIVGPRGCDVLDDFPDKREDCLVSE